MACTIYQLDIGESIVLIRYGTDANGKPVKKAIIYTKQEHGIVKEKIDSDALKIVERLRDAGFAAYIVGGAVRDLIVGNMPKDFDIVTEATPLRIKRLFRNSRIIGKRFRLVHVIVGQKIFEVSTFRSTAEGSTGNNFGSMDEDVRRRDFTINALYYDPSKEHVIDYVGGVRDIKKQVLNPVISLDRIFVEDPVRMIRAIKYSALADVRMSLSLRRKIRQSANLLQSVPPSRLTEELLKIINSSHMYDIVREALDTDLYIYLQPAASSFIYADKNFKNAYLESLKNLDSFTACEGNARLGRKLAFLLTDFISTLTDWQKEVAMHTPSYELYAHTWRECRHFVLPMNPQRTELEFAVKMELIERGVKVQGKKRVRAQTAAEEKLQDK